MKFRYLFEAIAGASEEEKHKRAAEEAAEEEIEIAKRRKMPPGLPIASELPTASDEDEALRQRVAKLARRVKEKEAERSKEAKRYPDTPEAEEVQGKPREKPGEGSEEITKVAAELGRIAATLMARMKKYFINNETPEKLQNEMTELFNRELEKSHEKILALDNKIELAYDSIHEIRSGSGWEGEIEAENQRKKFEKRIEKAQIKQRQIIKDFEYRWEEPGRKTKSEIEKELKKKGRTSRDLLGKSRSRISSASLDKLQRLLNKLISQAGTEFVDDPEGLEQYINTVSKDFANAEKKLNNIFQQMDKLLKQREESTDKEDPEYIQEYSRLSLQANKIVDDLKEIHIGKESKPVLSDNELPSTQWYNDKFREYLYEAMSLPGAPAFIREVFNDLAGNQAKFASAKAKFADITQIKDDYSLIKQVANGVKPIAHVKSVRRHVILKDQDVRFLAYVIAPKQMGGGAIWYRPYIRNDWKHYDERIKGLDPDADKEERPTRPYDPLKRDPNLNIVELYMWNCLANKSDPRIYNFINGICLGYHRHFVIWFCESKYGQIDHRQPDRSFFSRLVDRAAYCIRANVDGYGRPGTIKPDGMFSALFKSLTRRGLGNFLDTILGKGSLYGSYHDFTRAAAEYPGMAGSDQEIEREAEIALLAHKQKIQDPIVESMFEKINNI